MKKLLTIALGLSVLGIAPVITGCDDKKSETTTYKKNDDGSVTKTHKETKVNDDGDVTKTEKHTVDRP